MNKPLTVAQLNAADLLGQGITQTDAAKQVGYSRATIVKWLKLPEFQREVERRKAIALEAHQSQSRLAHEGEAAEFQQELAVYRKKRLDLYRMKLAIGQKMLQVAGNRLKDLPDEAIAPQMIPGMIAAADKLTEGAMQGWSEIIGLDELLQDLLEQMQKAEG